MFIKFTTGPKIIRTSLLLNVLIAYLNGSISLRKKILIGICLLDSHHHASPISKNTDLPPATEYEDMNQDLLNQSDEYLDLWKQK